MSCQLNAPARYVGGDALPLLLRCEDQIGKAGARYALRDRCLRLLWRRGRRPFVRRPAGHKSHVIARFGRESAVVRLPGADSAWACIVGCRRESEIAKSVEQFS